MTPKLAPIAVMILILLSAGACVGPREDGPTILAGPRTSRQTAAAAPQGEALPEKEARAEPRAEDTPAGEDAPSEADDAKTDESAEPGGQRDDEAETDDPPRRIVLETVYDDRRVGDDQTEVIEAEMGLFEDEELTQYVRSVAIRLLRYAPPRPFEYEFKIVDQTMPNAFALPGGKIYVSRGLLALVESEDELAGVLGHEITHAAERHAAAQIELSRRINPFTIGILRAAKVASYSREHERAADRGGQLLAAQAGYDPNGISTFLRKLDAFERYEVGWARIPFFLATHPTSPERSATATDRASRLEWERAPAISADEPLGYYSMIDGLVIGDDPAGGLFEAGRFVHPDLGFSIRFPQDWTTMNTHQAVSAISPGRDAQAMLTVEGSGPDIAAVVDDFLEREAEGLRIRDRREIKIGELPAIRIEGRAGGPLGSLFVQMTFVLHRDLVYRLTMLSASGTANSFRGRARAFARSFRPIDEEERRSLQVTRIRVARARGNETLEELAERTRNELDLVYTGVLNGSYSSTRLAPGTPIKIGVAEPYLPKPRADESVAEGTPESEGESPTSAGAEEGRITIIDDQLDARRR